jgi:tetratricopeptide (TPR) repeat protein
MSSILPPVGWAIVAVAIALPRLAAGQDSARAAQAAASNIAVGDSLFNALNASAALGDYEAAIAADSTNYQALWKAARSAVDLGEFDPDERHRIALYQKAAGYARRAVAVHPDSATAHFHLARALGREAQQYGPRTRVQFAKEVRSEALEALKIDSTNPGALHVMGVWNAEIMRLSGFSRFIAKSFLGGGIFGQASWKNAIDYMQRSVAADPNRIVHHLDLAKIYEDTGDKAKAKAEYQFVVDAPPTDYNDPHYKDDARSRLAKW